MNELLLLEDLLTDKERYWVVRMAVAGILGAIDGNQRDLYAQVREMRDAIGTSNMDEFVNRLLDIMNEMEDRHENGA